MRGSERAFLGMVAAMLALWTVSASVRRSVPTGGTETPAAGRMEASS